MSERDAMGTLLVAGRYEVLRRVGLGGMSEVVLATDIVLGRQVAVKLLSAALAADAIFVERFRREAAAAAGLRHPNLVVVYDYGVVDARPFIVMEYVEGPTLKQLLTREGPLPPRRAADYVGQLLSALDAAHAAGIVHRDVKPQNAIVRPDGTVKVTDFGVAKHGGASTLTVSGSLIGTADYIAPEQAAGIAVTPSADLYSAGVVLFEALTGELPFQSSSPLITTSLHVNRPAPDVRSIRPEILAPMAAVVRRALEKQPALRHASAQSMRDALRQAVAADGEVTGASLGSTIVRPPVADSAATTATAAAAVAPAAHARRRRIRRALTAAALVVTAALAALAVMLALDAGRGGQPPPPVRMPALTGATIAGAVKALHRLGLRVHRDLPAYSSTVRSGLVAEVAPAPGTQVGRGALVTLIPSAGPRPVAIPTLTGFTAAAALAALSRLGLAGQLEQARSPMPRGTVIATSPPPGMSVARHTVVVLTVSLGPHQPHRRHQPGNGKGR